MRKTIMILVVAVMAFFTPLAQGAATFNNETLKYVVTYKWGLIHKEAGDATLTLRRQGNHYNLRLVGSSRKWADKIYRVRDTLHSTLRVADLKPVSYTKKMHEGKRHDIDKISFTHNGNTTIGKTTRYRTKNGVPTVKEATLSATGPVYDFLSIFYYLRKLDYSQLNKYKSYTATTFSGSKKELVKIKSLGIEKIKMRDKTEREAYHIKFNFTQNGGKKSSDDIDAWISTDSRHIPLYLVGKLPIGEIRVYLTAS